MMVNSNQTQKDNVSAKTMFPAKNSHHSSKSTHDEKDKAINLQKFLCALNEKVNCTKHSKFSNLVPH